MSDSTAGSTRTWTRAKARRLHDGQARRGIVEPAGWIVRVPDRGPAPVAAGPTAREALALARELGHGEGRQASPATAAELDGLDLPPSALGIAPGAPPWWREPEPDPLPPDRMDRPVYRAVNGPESPIRSTLYVWGSADSDGVRRFLDRGELVGWLHRERTYSDAGDGRGMVPWFEIGADCREAVARDDVALPIVATPDGLRFLPEYPRCPDCGGRIAWAEGGRVPGSRRCEGMPDPTMPAAGGAASPGLVASEPDGCGSTFIDTRFGLAHAVPDGEGEQ